MRKDLLAMAGVVAIFVTGSTILMMAKVLPEEHAMDFRTLDTISLQSQNRVIKEPTKDDNTYIYAINDVAAQVWDTAKQDSRVKEVLDSIDGTTVTVAAVQPTSFVDHTGKVRHSGLGQIIITANWQLVDDRRYIEAESFSALDGRRGEAHQQIWNVFVDMNRRVVTDIIQERDRVMKVTLDNNIISSGMNMYLPNVVTLGAGSTVRWVNDSSVQHNVVGTYKDVSGETKVDSGFFRKDESWQYTFNGKGVFEYHCTIHAEEGMKGVLVIT